LLHHISQATVTITHFYRGQHAFRTFRPIMVALLSCDLLFYGPLVQWTFCPVTLLTYWSSKSAQRPWGSE